jgi:hypothetical protein
MNEFQLPKDCHKLFDELDKTYCGEGEQRRSLGSEMAERFINQLKAPGFWVEINVDALTDEDKKNLALTPAVIFYSGIGVKVTFHRTGIQNDKNILDDARLYRILVSAKIADRDKYPVV